MSNYTQPFADPLLEAAAQIRWQSHMPLTEAGLGSERRFFDKYPKQCASFITEAARQIDHLRAIGAISQAAKEKQS